MTPTPITNTRSGRALAQRPRELADFLALLTAEGVRSYVEVGARNGDTFVKVAEALPVPSLLVAVDLPESLWGSSGSLAYLEDAVAYARRLGHTAHLIVGRSTAPQTLAALDAIAPGFDCAFLDADHTEAAVRADWAAYGPRARLVAFHDIAPEPSNTAIGVPPVWAEVAATHRTTTFIDASMPGMGIGVCWTEPPCP